MTGGRTTEGERNVTAKCFQKEMILEESGLTSQVAAQKSDRK